MNILYLLVPVALLLAAAGVGAFLWAVRSGQFDDTDTPAVRVLTDEEWTNGRKEERAYRTTRSHRDDDQETTSFGRAGS